MLLYYIIISVILFILVLHGYNKVKYKFWLDQPIFYRYNILNWCRRNAIVLTEPPRDTIHLNLLDNNVSYVTDTNNDAKIGNIYINEIDKSSKYYDDILFLINNYPYFNKKYNNGNMKFMDINRKLDKTIFNILLENHDYNPIITTNFKNIYKNDDNTSKIIEIKNVVGAIVSIPVYFYYKSKNNGSVNNMIHGVMPIYYSHVYYNSQEINENNVIQMISTYNYKKFHDWDEVIRRERDVILNETDETQQVREINVNSNSVNKNTNTTNITNPTNATTTSHPSQNIYEKNGLKISRIKQKIHASIFRYTGISIPKLIVPFVEYHSFYIPVTNWKTTEYRFHPSIHLIKIGTQNINIFLDYLQTYHTNNTTTEKNSTTFARLFDVSILPSFSHILHLIKNEIYSIYVLLQKNNAGIAGANIDMILAVYMFRKSCKTIIHKNGTNNSANDITYMPTSIQIPSTHDNFFICGFINSIKMEKKGGEMGCISIDTLSHNRKIIDFFLINNKPILVEKNTLLIHNYICKTLLPENIVIMN